MPLSADLGTMEDLTWELGNPAVVNINTLDHGLIYVTNPEHITGIHTSLNKPNLHPKSNAKRKKSFKYKFLYLLQYPMSCHFF